MDTLSSSRVDVQELIDNPATILECDDETLLNHFLEMRFIVMTETRISSSIDRVATAIQVARLEHQEILRRMAEGRCEPPF